MVTNIVKPDVRIVAFCCNWDAYSAIETAGLGHEEYPAGLKIVRLPCLGRVNTGMVLRAFEFGARGVLLLGCPEDACHYGTGHRQAQSVVAESRRLLQLLGIRPERVSYVILSERDAETFVSRVNGFAGMLDKNINTIGAGAR